MKNKKLIILFVLVAAVTAFIFFNSLKDIAESNRSSEVIIEIIEPVIETITDSEIDVYFIVRKGAHLAEFCLLGFVVLAAAAEIKKKVAGITGFGFFYVLAVAVTDEFLQSFFERTSSVSDVIIDFTGALIGFITFIFITFTIRALKKLSKS